eukprot:1624597-Pyramimonas_sp.AAC.1
MQGEASGYFLQGTRPHDQCSMRMPCRRHRQEARLQCSHREAALAMELPESIAAEEIEPDVQSSSI